MADIRSVHMLMQDHERFEAQLGTLRELLSERLAAARAELARTPTSLRRRARRRIGELEAAIARMDRGLYGICRTCGVFIALETLVAAPHRQECESCHRPSQRRAAV